MFLNYLVDSMEGTLFTSGLLLPGSLVLVSCQIDLPFFILFPGVETLVLNLPP